VTDEPDATTSWVPPEQPYNPPGTLKTKLTVVHSNARAIAVTRKGQAHWANPNSVHTCRECAHWQRTERRWNDGLKVWEMVDSESYKTDGTLRMRRCALYKRMTSPPVQGRLLPHCAMACHYIDLLPNPQALYWKPDPVPDPPTPPEPEPETAA
jgi:hypothetical protein